MSDEFWPYKSYEDWYDNGPGSEAFTRKCRASLNSFDKLKNIDAKDIEKHLPNLFDEKE